MGQRKSMIKIQNWGNWMIRYNEFLLSKKLKIWKVIEVSEAEAIIERVKWSIELSDFVFTGKQKIIPINSDEDYPIRGYDIDEIAEISLAIKEYRELRDYNGY